MANQRTRTNLVSAIHHVQRMKTAAPTLPCSVWMGQEAEERVGYMTHAPHQQHTPRDITQLNYSTFSIDYVR